MLFIWDSLAFTPSVSDVEGDFNPQSSVATKARILAKGMSKLIVPLADKRATFLVLNQLKTNIPQGPMARQIAMTTPYITPGARRCTTPTLYASGSQVVEVRQHTSKTKTDSVLAPKLR